MDSEKTHSAVLKQKEMRTVELLRMYEEMMNKLKKAQQENKNLKQRYEQSVLQYNRMQLEHERCTFHFDSVSQRNITLEKENRDLLDQKMHLEHQYNQYNVSSQLTIKSLEDELTMLKEIKCTTDEWYSTKKSTVPNDLERKIHSKSKAADAGAGKMECGDTLNSLEALDADYDNMMDDFLLSDEDEPICKQNLNTSVANGNVEKKQDKLTQSIGIQTVKFETRTVHTQTAETLKILKQRDKICAENEELKGKVLEYRAEIDKLKITAVKQSVCTQTEEMDIDDQLVEDILQEMRLPCLLSPIIDENSGLFGADPPVPVGIETPLVLAMKKDSEMLGDFATEVNNETRREVVKSPEHIEDSLPDINTRKRSKSRGRFANNGFVKLKKNYIKRLVNKTHSLSKEIKKMKTFQNQDYLLKALCALKQSKINFTISNDSIVPKFCNCKDLKEHDETHRSGNISYSSEHLNCVCNRCQSNTKSNMLLSNVNGRKHLLGFYDVKSEVSTPATSRMDYWNTTSLATLNKTTSTLNCSNKVTTKEVLESLAEMVSRKMNRMEKDTPKRKTLLSDQTDTFTSETETEIERLFDKSDVDILKRNKMLLEKAKEQNQQLNILPQEKIKINNKPTIGELTGESNDFNVHVKSLDSRKQMCKSDDDDTCTESLGKYDFKVPGCPLLLSPIDSLKNVDVSTEKLAEDLLEADGNGEGVNVTADESSINLFGEKLGDSCCKSSPEVIEDKASDAVDEMLLKSAEYSKIDLPVLCKSEIETRLKPEETFIHDYLVEKRTKEEIDDKRVEEVQSTHCKEENQVNGSLPMEKILEPLDTGVSELKENTEINAVRAVENSGLQSLVGIDLNTNLDKLNQSIEALEQNLNRQVLNESPELSRTPVVDADNLNEDVQHHSTPESGFISFQVKKETPNDESSNCLEECVSGDKNDIKEKYELSNLLDETSMQQFSHSNNLNGSVEELETSNPQVYAQQEISESLVPQIVEENDSTAKSDDVFSNFQELYPVTAVSSRKESEVSSSPTEKNNSKEDNPSFMDTFSQNLAELDKSESRIAFQSTLNEPNPQSVLSNDFIEKSNNCTLSDVNSLINNTNKTESKEEHTDFKEEQRDLLIMEILAQIKEDAPVDGTAEQANKSSDLQLISDEFMENMENGIFNDSYSGASSVGLFDGDNFEDVPSCPESPVFDDVDKEAKSPIIIPLETVEETTQKLEISKSSPKETREASASPNTIRRSKRILEKNKCSQSSPGCKNPRAPVKDLKQPFPDQCLDIVSNSSTEYSKKKVEIDPDKNKETKRVQKTTKRKPTSKLKSNILRQVREKRQMYRTYPVCESIDEPKLKESSLKRKLCADADNKEDTKIRIVQNILITTANSSSYNEHVEIAKGCDISLSNVQNSSRSGTAISNPCSNNNTEAPIKKKPISCLKKKQCDIVSKIIQSMNKERPVVAVKPKQVSTVSKHSIPDSADEKQWRKGVLEIAESIHNVSAKPTDLREDNGLYNPKSKLTLKRKILLKKLLKLSTEEKISDEVVLEFKRHDLDSIAEMVLQKVSEDVVDKPDNKYYPAPLMTRTQRILLGLMVRLEQDNVEKVMDTFLVKAEAFLFKIGTNIRTQVPVTRLYMAVCKLRRDIDRMREFCCKAFLFTGDLAVPLFFTVLTSWIEVLPMESSMKNYPLAKVLIQIVHLKTCNRPGYNLFPLRRLFNQFYGYPSDRWDCDELFEEVFHQYLSNPNKSSDIAIRLFCKNKDTKWVYQKVNQFLKPLIYKIPPENVNFKATVIILIGNICRHFKPKNEFDETCLNELRRWLIGLTEDQNVGELVKKSVDASLQKLPRKKSKAKKTKPKCAQNVKQKQQIWKNKKSRKRKKAAVAK